MLDSKIDVENKSDNLEFGLVQSEFLRIYYDDHHLIYNRILNHFLQMLDAGKVVDGSGNVLDRKCKEVKQFLESEEVKNCQLDQTLFDYLYDQLTNIEEVNANA